MRAYFELIPDIEIIAEAVDGQDALEQLQPLELRGSLPDVVLMDLLMPHMDGVAATAAIKTRYPLVEVVALTSFIEESKVQAVLEAGATGYLLKDAEAEEVAAAVRAAHRGEMHLDAAVAARLMRSLRAPEQADPLAELTEREREVLILVAQGRATKRSPQSWASPSALPARTLATSSASSTLPRARKPRCSPSARDWSRRSRRRAGRGE